MTSTGTDTHSLYAAVVIGALLVILGVAAASISGVGRGSVTVTQTEVSYQNVPTGGTETIGPGNIYANGWENTCVGPYSGSSAIYLNPCVPNCGYYNYWAPAGITCIEDIGQGYVVVQNWPGYLPSTSTTVSTTTYPSVTTSTSTSTVTSTSTATTTTTITAIILTSTGNDSK